tara:strand:- start:1317 stop:1595 length:279 start_codon:yes stop_codon:yes gene_type:complete
MDTEQKVDYMYSCIAGPIKGEALLVQIAEATGEYSSAAMHLLTKHFNERYSYCHELDYTVVVCEKGTCVCRGECDFDTWATHLQETPQTPTP